LSASPKTRPTKNEVAVFGEAYNLREWRHFFKLRTSDVAHPQMREIAVPLLAEFQKKIKIIFDELWFNYF
jgi:thymidylate synthase (FAD)